MKRLKLNIKKTLVFAKIIFGEPEKVTIFAPQSGNDCTYWRNGRVVDRGSLENC
jgi:hypothetical protein